MRFDEITRQTNDAVHELLAVARLEKGDILIVGCSTSEVMGARIGKGSSTAAAKAMVGRERSTTNRSWAEKSEDKEPFHMEKIGPIEKVYEAYSAIADERVRISEGERLAVVESSDRQKSYTVTWTENIYTSNDNASYWQGYAGYPMIAVLMLQEKLPLEHPIMECFRGIDWHQLNEKHKRDYAAAAQEAIAAKGLDPNEAKNAAEKVIDGLRTLDIVVKRGKLRPPKASK